MFARSLVRTLLAGSLFALLALPAVAMPQLQRDNGVSRLLVNGKPFLILGGELGNSRNCACITINDRHTDG